jgi:hypothetical protein
VIKFAQINFDRIDICIVIMKCDMIKNVFFWGYICIFRNCVFPACCVICAIHTSRVGMVMNMNMREG